MILLGESWCCSCTCASPLGTSVKHNDESHLDLYSTYPSFYNWGGVYMGKLAPARVSYRDEFFISFCVYTMTGSFHISVFEGTFYVDKHMVDSKLQTLHMHYQFQSTNRPISHRNELSFHVCMILLKDFVPEWNSHSGTTTKVNSCRSDSRQH